MNAKATPDERSDSTYPLLCVRAGSEIPRPHLTGARPPKRPEPTKPIMPNPSRKIPTRREASSSLRMESKSTRRPWVGRI